MLLNIVANAVSSTGYKVNCCYTYLINIILQLGILS